MSDFGATIAAGILAGILSHIPPPGTCDPAGRCYPWYGQYYPVPRPPPYLYPPPGYPLPAPPPPGYGPKPMYRPGPEEKKLKQDLLDFCATHMQEDFCQEMDAYLQKHPEVR